MDEFEVKARGRGGIIDLLVWAQRIHILGEPCVLTIACSIEERKRTEAALAQSERLLRVVLDAMPVGVVVVNTTGDVVLSNPALLRIGAHGLRTATSDGEKQSAGGWRRDGLSARTSGPRFAR